MAARAEVSYSHRPLSGKLGMREGECVAILNAPENFETTLGELPPGVHLVEALTADATTIIFFARDLDAYNDHIAAIAPYGEGRKIWIVWPKKSSGIKTDISENAIRDAALHLGLVDYKVCSIDVTWSGLLLTQRKR